MFLLFILSLTTILLVLLIWYKTKKKPWIEPNATFPAEWRNIIKSHIPFYNSLIDEEQNWFEYKVQEFLLNCRITGIGTNVTITDKLLVASSAVIPIFAFRNWKYVNLFEVLLYPASFNQDFETEGTARLVLGMVGSGYMEGKMILSKPALLHGFQNETDKKNTAIHEFVHLIDKSDGNTDGIPSLLLEKQYTIPWIDLMTKKIDEIFKNESDINPYGGTNRAEFFSVVSEYFFERPKLLASKHPKLYALLEQIFNQDMSSKSLKSKELRIGRNTTCPCGSGNKFKECCGKAHYIK